MTEKVNLIRTNAISQITMESMSDKWWKQQQSKSVSDQSQCEILFKIFSIVTKVSTPEMLINLMFGILQRAQRQRAHLSFTSVMPQIMENLVTLLLLSGLMVYTKR